MNVLEKWKSHPLFTEELMHVKDDKELNDRFYKNLEFGTGGLRAIMGAGSNRLNLITITKATAGLCRFMNDNNMKTCVIAYDTRNNSFLFAQQTDKVMEYFGIKCYLFSIPVPTPQLSFTVRDLSSDMGIVITASHNPKEYNGYKVYDNTGGQITDDKANMIIKYINNTDNEFEIFEKATSLSAEMIDNTDEFLEMQKNTDNNIHVPCGGDIKIVYTPLHGTGYIPCTRLLKELNYDFSVVESQKTPDGNFTNCASPNPEEKEALSLAIAQAKNQNADIVIATDPDADRVGVASRHNDEFIILTGNQIGYLLLDYLLQTKKYTKDMFVVKTIVTSDCAKALTLEKGVNTVEVLTGFKYIGEKMNENFFFGYEESVGYLASLNMRDKDAIGAVMLICAMADFHKKNGITLYARLIELYNKYGFYKEELISYTLPGADGVEKIKSIIRDFKENHPTGSVLHEDYSKGIKGLPKSNVQKFYFDNAWCVLRPSGTEPKLKLYISAWGDNAHKCTETIERIKMDVGGRIK